MKSSRSFFSGWSRSVSSYSGPVCSGKNNCGTRPKFKPMHAIRIGALDAAVGIRLADALRVRLTGTTFQQFEAFRLGDGRALGGGASFEWQASDRVRIDAGTLVLRQDAGRGGDDDVWNQTRGWFGLRYAFGDDPALRRGGR